MVETIEIASGYRIPRLVVGLWQLSEGHRPGSADSDRVVADLERFVEAGLDTFDCADIYTGVEELLGRLIRRSPLRDQIRVHTKFVPDRGALEQVDRDYVSRIVERSLRRLGVERLDLVQFAWWDYAVPGYVEALGWLGELQRAGKIRALGSTNFDVSRLQELAAADGRLISHQVQYSLLDRRPAHGLVDHCRTEDAWLLCYGSLAGGFLSERWLGAPAPEPPWANRSLQKYRLIIEDFGGWEAFQELLQLLSSIAAEHDTGIANVAARSVLDRPRVGAVIVGARDARHLEPNLATFDVALGQSDRQRLEMLLSGHPGPPGDVFGLERASDGPHAAIMRYDLNRGS